MGELDKYKGFKAELAVAETFEEIRNIEIKATAVAKAAAEFAKTDMIGKKEQDEWGEFRVGIKAKKGALLEAKFPKGGDRKSKSSKPTLILADEGITKDESSNARLIHDEPDL